MPENNTGAATADGETNRSYWFHILAGATPADRNLHAVRLVDKAWQQGDRVCIVCDQYSHAEELDELLWNFAPEAFIPHSIVPDSATRCPDPVGILLCEPVAEDWDTVVILSTKLPADADRFSRLALVAHNDPQTLNIARSQFKQLRALGIEPRVHDQRKR